MSDPGFPEPPAIDGLDWRPATLEDAAALAALHAACYEVDGGYLMVPSEYRDELDDDNDDVERDTLVAVGDAGEIVAFVALHVPGGEATERRCFPWGNVHPEWRRRGVGSFLVRWSEARAAERFASFDDGLGTVIRVSAYDTQADRIALFERFGYAASRYFTEMIRDLSGPLPELVDPDGIEIRAWDDAYSEAARAVHNEAFADHWGSQPVTEYAWERWRTEFWMPDASFVAFDGDRAVGYLMSAMYPHDFESRGRTEAWTEGLGTIRSHRGRGIASALLLHAMTVYRDRGLGFAALGVDTDNPTGAFGLYTKLGFEAEKTSITFLKPGP